MFFLYPRTNLECEAIVLEFAALLRFLRPRQHVFSISLSPAAKRRYMSTEQTEYFAVKVGLSVVIFNECYLYFMFLSELLSLV